MKASEVIVNLQALVEEHGDAGIKVIWENSMDYEEIRFNDPYTKLHGQEYATLVNVDLYEFGDWTNKETIKYDTDGGDYKFKPGETYIQLVFLGDKEIPFTTYRKMKAGSMMYYVRRLGQVFKIVIGGVE